MTEISSTSIEWKILCARTADRINLLSKVHFKDHRTCVGIYVTCLLFYSAKLCDLALESGKIFEDEGFKYIKESFENGTLHLIGLLSDGGVHSRLDQLQVNISHYVSSYMMLGYGP